MRGTNRSGPLSRSDGDLGCEPEVVYETGDQGLFVMGGPMLLSVDIDCMVRGEGVQDLFACGRFPGAWSPAAGPMQIFVMPSEGADGGAILASLANRDGIQGPEAGYQEPEHPPASFLWRNVARLLKWESFCCSRPCGSCFWRCFRRLSRPQPIPRR